MNQTNAGLAGSQYDALTGNNAYSSNALQQMLTNIQNTNSQNAGYTNQQLSNAANLYNTGTNIAQQTYNNANTLSNSLNSLYNNQYNWLSNALNNQAQLAQQQYGNITNTTNANNAILQAILGNSALPINTLAGSVEGMMAIPTSLWNASIGLNGSSTGALGALAGTGTTYTKSRTDGGNFLTGLFG